MSGHRQAAVALHGLAEADRQQILSQLPAADQRTLRSYLAELKELGFASGANETLMQAAMAGAARPANGQERLQAASAQQVYDILAWEPASLVAEVLAAGEWAWQADFLALCTPARRQGLELAAPRRAVPVRSRFVLEALAERLAAPRAAVMRRAGWGQCIFSRLGAWTR
ncbi:hypothetical protein [Massilia sp. BJB1822]|uniref:hypothetical protein n=1 Tax=Massilia sp. BJB1822 TaxID=2744470 RepID=UPI0015946F34|nr:hypothetical protein [Massilia sp. BJB1822]NVE01861.1 hypothetical protein [Massilia sp. BJB1822]